MESVAPAETADRFSRSPSCGSIRNVIKRRRRRRLPKIRVTREPPVGSPPRGPTRRRSDEGLRCFDDLAVAARSAAAGAAVVLLRKRTRTGGRGKGEGEIFMGASDLGSQSVHSPVRPSVRRSFIRSPKSERVPVASRSSHMWN